MANQGNDTVSFTVDGMGCGGCAAGIATTLRGAPGVREAEVTFETRRASISYDPARTSPDALAEVIREEGYTVTPLAP
ncbi:MAG: heavy-metal-associated domain-containing protein [Actinomycetota bacterium]